MYTKQSAYVLALFLGTASTVSITENFATGMNGDEDLGEDITMKGDKFHFNQYLMMDAEPAANATAPAAANATAAPAGVSAATPAAKYPAPEKVHTLDPKIAKAHTTFYNGKKDGPKESSLIQYIKDSRDISEKGINEDVQDFANKYVERLPWPRSEEPFVPNGSKVTFDAASPVPALYQRYNRDISEKGINEDVQDFANKHVERLPWPRSEESFVPNGSKVTFPAAAAPALYQRQRNGRDISEKNIDAEVHGLANSMVDRINWNRSQEPFIPNGSQVTFPAAAPSLYQRQRNGRDISEKNIDAEVHGLANSMVDRINWNRSQEPFIPNGSQVTFPAAAPSLYQRQRNGRDISEKNIDAEVHGLANSMVDRINWNRSQEPFIPNGSQVTFPAAQAAAFYQNEKHDIANKEVRPDVWVTVHNMVDPVSLGRYGKAPKSNYEDWWGEGPPPMQELEKPKCPEEIEEPVNPMKKKLDKQAKKAKAKKEKEDAEMPGDIEEKKDEKKEDKKDEKKGDAKDAKDEKKDEKDDAKDEKKDDAKDAKDGKDGKEEEKKEEKKDEKLAQNKKSAENMPPKSSLMYDNVNNLWRSFD